eukprot:COSAG01_NODE_2258_length_8063_cov_10.409216_2_plen_895_part_00
MLNARIRFEDGLPVDEGIRDLVERNATLFVAKIQGHLEDEHKLASLFGRHGAVLAVTLRARLGATSYALVTFAEASKAVHLVAFMKEKKTSNRKRVSSFTIPEARSLVCSPMDAGTLADSHGVMRQCIHQHAEQVRLARQSGVPEVAVCTSCPVFTLAVLGDIVAVGSSDATVCALNLSGPAAGQLSRWQLRAHTGSVRAMCGCSYGVLFTAACDGTVRATKLQSTAMSADDKDGRRTIPWCFAGHSAGVTTLCHHSLPDGKALLFSGSWDHSVCALDTMTGVPRWRYTPSHPRALRDRSEKQWLAAGRETGDEQDPEPGVISIATGTESCGGDIVVLGTSTGAIHALQASTGRMQQHKFRDYSSTHCGGITDLTISGGVVYSGSADVSGKFTMAFDIFTGAKRWVLDWHDGKCLAMAVDVNLVFSASESTVFATDKETGKQRWRFTAFKKRVRGMCYSHKRQLLFVSSADESVRAIDEHGRQRWCFSGHTAGVRVLYLSKTEDTLFSGSGDCTVRALSVDPECKAETRERWCYKCHKNKVTVLAGCTFDGTDVVFSSGWDMSVHAVDAGTGKSFWDEPAGPLGGEVNTMTVCDPGEGPMVVVGTQDKTIQALDAASGQALWVVDEPCGAVMNVSFVNGLVYTCSALRKQGKPLAKIRALDACTGIEVYEKGFKTAPTAIHHTAVVGVDHHVLVGFEDGTLRVLSKQLHQTVEMPGQHTEAINHLDTDAEWLWSASTGPVVMTNLKALCHYSLILSGPLGDRSTQRGKIDHLRNHFLPRVDLVLRSILMITTVLQLMALVVNHQTVDASDDFRVAIDWVRELNLQSGRMGVGRMLTIYLLTTFMVMSFIVVFAFQEALEWKNFIYPNSSSWSLLWLGLSFFCQVYAPRLAQCGY